MGAPGGSARGEPGRRPWPMWPIGLAIAVFVVVYTWVNLEYRKPDRAFEPYRALQERKEAAVEKNFYDWYRLRASRAPEEPLATTLAAPAARPLQRPLEKVLPEELVYYLPSRPVLLPALERVASAADFVPGEPLRLALWLPEALVDDERFRLKAFYKEGALHLLAQLYVESLEEAAGALGGEPRRVDFAIPSDPFEGPEIRVALYVEGAARHWTVERRRENGKTAGGP